MFKALGIIFTILALCTVILSVLNDYVPLSSIMPSIHSGQLIRSDKKQKCELYPKLDDILCKVISSQNISDIKQNYPDEFVEPAKLRVDIVINDNNFHLYPNLGNEELRLGNSIQAIVYVESLAKLANIEQIQSIKLHNSTIPQAPNL